MLDPYIDIRDQGISEIDRINIVEQINHMDQLGTCIYIMIIFFFAI